MNTKLYKKVHTLATELMKAAEKAIKQSSMNITQNLKPYVMKTSMIL